tara:strand:- start:171 stop:344 length:174 start_codon:yes stop_codon:yes gene_type:complete
MVEETSINKSCIKVKTKKKGYVGLTDVNELQYKQLKNLWDILQKGNKFDKNKNENKI